MIVCFGKWTFDYKTQVTFTTENFNLLYKVHKKIKALCHTFWNWSSSNTSLVQDFLSYDKFYRWYICCKVENCKGFPLHKILYYHGWKKSCNVEKNTKWWKNLLKHFKKKTGNENDC